MPCVPPDRGRSGLRPLDEYQVVSRIQGLRRPNELPSGKTLACQLDSR
jgi:hypothetical protein